MPIFLQGNVEECPAGMKRWDPMFFGASEVPIAKSARDKVGFRDALCYIYTSGTTGSLVLMYYYLL